MEGLGFIFRFEVSRGGEAAVELEVSAKLDSLGQHTLSTTTRMSKDGAIYRPGHD